MKPGINKTLLLVLITLGVAACSSSPALEPLDNRADIQKYKAEKAQQELASEISKIEK